MGTSMAHSPVADKTRRRRLARWVLGGIFVLAGLSVAAYLSLRTPRGQQPPDRNPALAARDSNTCLTCHGQDGHPAIAGHKHVSALGCPTCHNGTSASDKASAHATSSEGVPFFSKNDAHIACARCHIPGQRGLERLEKGARLFAAASCIGCHQPGRNSEAALGPDLRQVANLDSKHIMQKITNPGSESMMWSITDPTYAHHIDAKTTLALVHYVQALSDQTTRNNFRAKWHKPTLKNDTPCSSCHFAADKANPHTCSHLKSNPTLRCARCHTAPPPSNKPCRFIRAASTTCQGCHLRSTKDQK